MTQRGPCAHRSCGTADPAVRFPKIEPGPTEAAITPDFRFDGPPPSSSDRPSVSRVQAHPGGTPIVSIVTPFYNAGVAFEATAGSVAQQSFLDWEWIVVNDGSTDVESLEVLSRAAESDPRISVITRPENGGPGAARNDGIRAAEGEFIMQLDDDDQLEPTAVEKLVWFLLTHPEYGFAKGYTIGFGEESYLWPNGFHEGDRFLTQNHADVMTMVRTDVAQAAGGYNEATTGGLEDWEFWLACADAGYWGGTIHEPLGWYRRRASHSETWANWDGGEREADFREGLRRRFPGLFAEGVPVVSVNHEAESVEPALPPPSMNAFAAGKPRALFVVPWLAVGGADQVNLDLIESLMQRGWEVTVATTVQGDYRWESRFAALAPDLFVMHRFLPTGAQPSFLRYLIDSRRPDVVVVTNSEFGYELLPYLRAHCPDPAYVDLCHAEQSDWLSGGYPQLSNTYRRYLDTRIVASAHLRDWMAERVGDVSDVAVCHIGVDVDLLRPDTERRESVRSSWGLSDDDVLIVFIGRVAAEKQPMMLIEVMDRLVASEHNPTMVVIGDGPDLASVRDETRRRGLEPRLRLDGSATDEHVWDALVAGDIFLLPSEREGIARTLCEAMAVGMPPVAANVGGQAELVGSDSGFLVDRSDFETEASAYTNSLAALIGDPEERRAMGERARQVVVAGFSLSSMTDRFAGLLESAVAGDRFDRVSISADDRDAAVRMAVESLRQRNEMYAAQIESQSEPDSPERASPILVQSRRLFGPVYRSLRARAPGLAARLRDLVHKFSGTDT